MRLLLSPFSNVIASVLAIDTAMLYCSVLYCTVPYDNLVLYDMVRHDMIHAMRRATFRSIQWSSGKAWSARYLVHFGMYADSPNPSRGGAAATPAPTHAADYEGLRP